MLEGMNLNQYVPMQSPLHQLDPRSKVIGTLLLVIAVFTVSITAELAVLVVVALTLALISRVPRLYFWSSLKPFLFIIIITAIVDAFLVPGPPLLTIAGHNISRAGIVAAGVLTLRLVLLIAFLRLLTLTTSPIMLTRGWEAMLGPLARLGFPLSELLMIMNLALSFLPFFLEEAGRIHKAQTSRGMSLKTGSPGRRVGALLSLLVPLVSSSLDRADRLAEAMEARAYRSGQQRSSRHILRMQSGDYVYLLLVGGISMALILL